MNEGLYHTLWTENIKRKPLSKKELEKLDALNNLDEKQSCAVADLIKVYSKYHPTLGADDRPIVLSSREIPYQGEQKELGVRFEKHAIPPQLGRMIIKFLRLVNGG